MLRYIFTRCIFIKNLLELKPNGLYLCIWPQLNLMDNRKDHKDPDTGVNTAEVILSCYYGVV
jgi:hypothetical protein